MVQIFKNFLLLQREGDVPQVVTMARNMGAWFTDERRIWHTKNPIDRMILVYRDPINTDNTIHDILSHDCHNVIPRLGTCIGYIQLYYQGRNVKVGKFQFVNGIDTRPYWVVLKQYLVQSIRSANIPFSQMHTFVLYWERRNMNREMKGIASAVGLLSNRQNMTYVFQGQDLGVQPMLIG